jgi:hypothetical protein
MSCRGSTTGLLLLALVVLCDPTSIAGFWDNGDHDDLAFRLASMASAADMNLVVALSPAPVVTVVVTLEPASSRAPPVHA